MSDNKTLTFEVDPLSCSGCTKSVEKALNNLGGMDEIKFDLETKNVQVKTTKSSLEIIEAIGKTGKTAVLK
ncbi:11580_t:CDS:2 [Funneliformis geosporum]|uniref:13580_t:CDS:1 n=1 Tax=Funneliformis geosporum TaxID=1117311 RepID=A0A9W4SD80_9GLOM|nr:11580_t:CDS:2 [Funneliformis geosporum]CAI2165432.1 13580_t:CDS:2 [Funneliformis geosporum]